MAVLSTREPFVRATDFAAGLDRAGRGVVRVVAGDRPVCTGFLITDDLVVVPAPAHQTALPPYACHFGADPESRPAALVDPCPPRRPPRPAGWRSCG
jgi:hypothetical protein